MRHLEMLTGKLSAQMEMTLVEQTITWREVKY